MPNITTRAIIIIFLYRVNIIKFKCQFKGNKTLDKTRDINTSQRNDTYFIKCTTQSFSRIFYARIYQFSKLSLSPFISSFFFKRMFYKPVLWQKWTAVFSLFCFSICTANAEYVERFVYSKLSCEDLIPRHSSLFTTTTSTTTKPEESMTSFPTLSATRKPFKKLVPNSIQSLRTPVEVTMLNGYSYAPGRLHESKWFLSFTFYCSILKMI